MPKTRALHLLATAFAASLAVAAAPGDAAAAPYAYASNTIDGLTVTFRNGDPLTGVTNTFTSVSGSAQYDASSAVSPPASGFVGDALGIPQVFVGPGPAPAEQSSPSPLMEGVSVGARADAGIGAGNASSGGVSVFNVAEGYGAGAPGTSGQSSANNQASITFSIVGTGQRVRVSFSNLVQLIASTSAAAGETANARIANTFAVFDSNGNEVFSRSPGTINRQVGSGNGVPPLASINETYDISLVTSVLAAGQEYTLSLTSSATESIRVGAAEVPEPASLLLLGAGLLGLAAMQRRRA